MKPEDPESREQDIGKLRRRRRVEGWEGCRRLEKKNWIYVVKKDLDYLGRRALEVKGG